MTTVGDILEVVGRLAPWSLAESWDNVGLLVGEGEAEVRRLLVALDVTEAVCDEAAEVGAEMILTHHPLVFRPLERVTGETPTGRLVLRLAREGRALAAAHTNLDAAEGGLADLLARALGLVDLEPLRAAAGPPRFKVVTFVPAEALEAVAQAAFEAGAGRVGRYTETAFESAGTGRFRPGPGASPAEGEVGRTNRVAEVRLETVVPADRLTAVVEAAARAHPYEEPVIDAYALHDPPTRAGLGRVGVLEASTRLAELADKVKEVLGCESVRVAGDPAAPVVRAGLVTGSGGGMTEALLRAGADAYVTGELKYHEAADLAARGIGVVLAGHWWTERRALEAWVPRLAEAVEAEVLLARRERDPLRVR